MNKSKNNKIIIPLIHFLSLYKILISNLQELQQTQKLRLNRQHKAQQQIKALNKQMNNQTSAKHKTRIKYCTVLEKLVKEKLKKSVNKAQVLSLEYQIMLKFKLNLMKLCKDHCLVQEGVSHTMLSRHCLSGGL